MAITIDATAWEARAEQLSASGRAFIGNESVDARSGETFEKRSPVDGRRLASVAAGDAPDVDDAVRAARKAFEDGVWAGLTPRDRKKILLEYADSIAAAKEELALLSTLEMGTPLSAIRLGELAAEAGLPPGVLNVVPGFGETAGQAVGRHNDVDVVSFTGSGEVGKLFLRYSGESNMKAVWLECGGKSPNIVLADAPDLDKAADEIVGGIFVNAGQMCNP